MLMPSVTQVLQPWADFSRIPPDVLQFASERGTAVHNACFAYSAGLPVVNIRPDVAPYVESFKRWFDKVVDHVILCEQRIIDDDFGYHGEPDMLIKAKHQEIILIDVKTPVTKVKTWQIQLSAYHDLCRKHLDIKIDRAGSLRLSPDGKTPKMDYYDYQQKDFSVFINALNCYKFFNS